MQMASGGQQQMNWVDQMARAMQQINQTTMQNLASTRQTETPPKISICWPVR